MLYPALLTEESLKMPKVYVHIRSTIRLCLRTRLDYAPKGWQMGEHLDKFDNPNVLTNLPKPS